MDRTVPIFTSSCIGTSTFRTSPVSGFSYLSRTILPVRDTGRYPNPRRTEITSRPENVVRTIAEYWRNRERRFILGGLDTEFITEEFVGILDGFTAGSVEFEGLRKLK